MAAKIYRVFMRGDRDPLDPETPGPWLLVSKVWTQKVLAQAWADKANPSRQAEVVEQKEGEAETSLKFRFAGFDT